MESFKTVLQTHHYMCNNFASTKRALNFVHFSGNEPRMAKSAQNWRICPYGNGNLTIPDKVTQFTLQLLNVSIPVLQKCPADTYHKNQSFKRYSRFSSKKCDFSVFSNPFFANISTRTKIQEKWPATKPHHLSIWSRMQIFRKIVRKVFEISHFWGVFCIRIFRCRSGSLPVAKSRFTTRKS